MVHTDLQKSVRHTHGVDLLKGNFLVMKSHVKGIMSVCAALFADITHTFPELKESLKLDLSTLRRTSSSRGIHLFVVDLPSLGKHFDRCLSKGHWTHCNLPLTRARHAEGVLPIWLGELFKMVFEADGCLKNDYAVEAIIFIRQVLYLSKKLSLPFSPLALRTAVRSLIDEDYVLPYPEDFWNEVNPSLHVLRNVSTGFASSEHYKTRLGRDGSRELDPVVVVLANLDKVSGLVSSTLGRYDPSDWSFKHGPGAISQVTGPTDKYQWYGWSDALESVFPAADYGFHNYTSWAGSTHWFRDAEYTPYSRLVAVPKTYEKPRLIAAEPSEHQWCQQNIWHYLKSQVSHSWLSKFVRFNDQTLNQELCRKGSLDGSLCTIDLSSASDRVSCHAVACFFRTNLGLLNALRASRTRELRQNLDKDLPKVVSLRKFSTMGSACTFPVETLLFLSIAIAVVLTNRRKPITKANIEGLEGEVAVFGDDIIVPTDTRELLQRTLEILDFRVNSDKSFSEGFFRESCGVDCFKGVNVTPIYLQNLAADTPESTASVVDTANNFYKLFYLRVAAFLGSTLPPRIAVVHVDSGQFGLKSRLGTAFSRKRWNANLQREEVQVLGLYSAQGILDQETDSSLHQYFTEAPSPHDEWEAGVRTRPQLKMRLRWVPISECLNQA